MEDTSGVYITSQDSGKKKVLHLHHSTQSLLPKIVDHLRYKWSTNTQLTTGHHQNLSKFHRGNGLHVVFPHG